ncbi:MAG: SRPBCC family protein [Alphaproteobacteria bacterium]|nr:SRPBCC family protein [Alphaproteobacteria bacterium]
MGYSYSDQAVADLSVSAQSLFDHLDDQGRLGAHMGERSMMMMGGRMTYEFDAAQGRAIGSVIKMGGSFLGIPLSVEEVVVTREPPHRKVWETRGQPRILIIGSHRMGFEITPSGSGVMHLRVFIDYDLPASLFGRIVGRLFAPMYARWCVKRMAMDAARHFSA